MMTSTTAPIHFTRAQVEATMKREKTAHLVATYTANVEAAMAAQDEESREHHADCARRAVAALKALDA